MSLRIAYLAGRPYLVDVGEGVMYALAREETQSVELTDKFGRPLTAPSREPFPAPIYGEGAEPVVIRKPSYSRSYARRAQKEHEAPKDSP